MSGHGRSTRDLNPIGGRTFKSGGFFGGAPMDSMSGHQGCERSAKMTTHIDIFIRREDERDPSHHQVHEGITVEALKIHLANGGEMVGIFLFDEDSDEPLHDGHEIRGHGDGHGPRILHHSRCRHVHVVVRYAGRPAERSFGPGSTLTRIKDWAEREFGIGAVDAAELSLQLSGTTDRPDETVHVGSLAKCPDCRVVFDLLPTIRVNGGI